MSTILSGLLMTFSALLSTTSHFGQHSTTHKLSSKKGPGCVWIKGTLPFFFNQHCFLRLYLSYINQVCIRTQYNEFFWWHISLNIYYKESRAHVILMFALVQHMKTTILEEKTLQFHGPFLEFKNNSKFFILNYYIL